MNIEITGITVLEIDGTDEVVFETTLPNGIWPFTGNANLKLYVAHRKGVQYVEDNFPGVEYKVIRQYWSTRRINNITGSNLGEFNERKV